MAMASEAGAVLAVTWDDDDILVHAEIVALARTQSRSQAARVEALPPGQARMFVRRLWEYAGSLDAGGTTAPALVAEPALADDVAAVLARLGVATTRADVQGQVQLSVPGLDDHGRFLREVVLARSGEAAYGAARAVPPLSRPGA